MDRRHGRKLTYQTQLISTQQSRHTEPNRLRLDTAMKRKDPHDRGARRHQCHRQGYWGPACRCVGAAPDPHSDAATAPLLQGSLDQPLTATSSAAANELAFIGLFDGQQIRKRGSRSSMRSTGPLFWERSLWPLSSGCAEVFT